MPEIILFSVLSWGCKKQLFKKKDIFVCGKYRLTMRSLWWKGIGHAKSR